MRRCWVCDEMEISECVKEVGLDRSTRVHICDSCWAKMHQKDYGEEVMKLISREETKCH